MARWLLVAGALNGALAVALGAFAAHALRGRLAPAALALFETANRYHFYHALALLVAGALALHAPAAPGLRGAGLLLLAGCVLFCGSLYLLPVTGVRWLGAVTPVGGVAFILGWLCLAWAAARGW